MDLSWYDLLGTLGVMMVLGAYAALQTGVLKPDQKFFSLLNFLGAGLILISLIFDFNFAAFVIEAAWAAISLYGLVRKAA